MSLLARAHIGHGIALRPEHYDRAGELGHAVGWLEVISEAFLGASARARRDLLATLRCDLPIGLHGTRLSIGSVDPLDTAYLESLKALVDFTDPVWVSDHMAWSSFGGRPLDILPLPYTEEALAHVARRIVQVQDVLQRRMLFENPSTYVAFGDSTLTEWEFLAEVSEQADCGLLLDVNNLYVSAQNNGFDAGEYLRGLPPHRVCMIHLSGHRSSDDLLLDTHEGPVPPAVWSLYRQAIERFGARPTIVEWEWGSPTLAETVAECRRAARIEEEVHESRRNSGGVLCADLR